MNHLLFGADDILEDFFFSKSSLIFHSKMIEDFAIFYTIKYLTKDAAVHSPCKPGITGSISVG